MMPYELPAAIEQAIATFRSRHEDLSLYLKTTESYYLIKIKDPESGFVSSVYIYYDTYREQNSYNKFETDLIVLLETLYDEICNVLEGRTCAETAN